MAARDRWKIFGAIISFLLIIIEEAQTESGEMVFLSELAHRLNALLIDAHQCQKLGQCFKQKKIR